MWILHMFGNPSLYLVLGWEWDEDSGNSES